MIALFIGKKGCGKSALMRKLADLVLHRVPGALVFYHDPHGQIAGTAFESIEQWRGASSVPVLSVFRNIEPDEVAELALAVGDVTLCLDELDLVSRNKEWTAPHVRRVVHYGRHARVNLFGGFRRTANVPEDVLSQADHVFLFRHDETALHDLRAVEQRFGEPARLAVTQLEPMHFVHLGD